MTSKTEMNELVQRYSVHCHCRCVDVVQRDDGHLVMHSDYIAMQRRAEAAEARIAELGDNCASLSWSLGVAEGQIAALRGEQVPVAWTDAEELSQLSKVGCAYLFTAHPISPDADLRRVIKLFTTPQAAPVVVLPDASAKNFYLSDGTFRSEDYQKSLISSLKLQGITVKSADGEGE